MSVKYDGRGRDRLTHWPSYELARGLAASLFRSSPFRFLLCWYTTLLCTVCILNVWDRIIAAAIQRLFCCTLIIATGFHVIWTGPFRKSWRILNYLKRRWCCQKIIYFYELNCKYPSPRIKFFFRFEFVGLSTNLPPYACPILILESEGVNRILLFFFL